MNRNLSRRSAAAAAAVLAAAMLTSGITSVSAATPEVFDKNSYVQVSASYAKRKAVISWKKFPGANYYQIYRSENGGAYKSLARVTGLSYTDTRMIMGRTYRYKVYAQQRKDHETITSEVSEYICISTNASGKGVVTVYDEPVEYLARPETKKKVKQEQQKTETFHEDAVEEVDLQVAGENGQYRSASGQDSSDSSTSSISYSSTRKKTVKAGTLTAGRVNDNQSYKNFSKNLENDQWKTLIQKWDMSPASRIDVTVTDGYHPIDNAVVQLLDGAGEVIYSTLSDNKGKAYVYSSVSGSPAVTLKVISPTEKCEFTADVIEIKNNKIRVKLDPMVMIPLKKLDLMFVVDTTGSMSDELEYLQKELTDVVRRVKKENTGLTVRTSVEFYRDLSDDYVVKAYPFRDKLATVRSSITSQEASGGGDYPEAVSTAIDIAINDQNWNEDTVKLMFLVLDAPPHQTNSKEYKNLVLKAASKGIRIIPVVSSGADTETEYLMRTTAALTNGYYIFLTDDSGVGDAHKSSSRSTVEVSKLNDTLVDTINEYLVTY